MFACACLCMYVCVFYVSLWYPVCLCLCVLSLRKAEKDGVHEAAARPQPLGEKPKCWASFARKTYPAAHSVRVELAPTGLGGRKKGAPGIQAQSP